MDTVLLSNIPHYHYLARALFRGGLLQRYITSIALGEHDTPSRWIPDLWRAKLEGRRLKGLHGSDTRQIRFPELMQRLLPRARLASREQADWINNHFFDRAASTLVEPCRVFHFVSSVGLYSARKARDFGARLVCDVRQEHPLFQRRILEEEAARFGLAASVPSSSYEDKVLAEFSLADYIVTPSQHARRTFLSEGFPQDRVLVLPYGVDLEYFPEVTHNPASPFRVVYVGQITLRKGILDLLEAFRLLKMPGAELLLIGTMDRSLLPLLRPYQHLFRHLEAVPKTALTHYYANSSVFVLPSLADSFSLATLEAMASGLPVIVTPNTGASELLCDGKQGFIVPIRNPDAIASKLQILYDQRTMCSEMGRSAQRLARGQSWEKYEDEALSIYRTSGLAHGLPL